MLLYRVTLFGNPQAPWRRSKKRAEADAIELGLGSRDDRGRVYLSPGADLAWVHEYEMARLASAHPASNTRTPAQERQQAQRRA